MPINESGGALFFASGIDNSGLKTGVSNAVGMIQGLKTSIMKINPFAALSAAAALAFAKAIQNATQFELEFRKTMTEVMTISDEVAQNYEYFGDEILNIAKMTGEGTDVLVKGLYQIISASFSASESLELLATGSKAALAGFTDTETSIDSITTVLNAWGLSAEDGMRIADTFFNTVKAGKTTFEQYGRSVSEVAPIASQAGISFEDISEAVAELTKRGTPTSQAITQIRSAIIATTQTLGDGVFETNSLREAFRLMSEQAGGSFNTLKDDAGRIEAVNAILALTSSSAEEVAIKYAEFMDSIAGSTEKAYSKVEGLTQTSWKKIQHIITDALRPLGDTFVDWLEGIGTGLVELLTKTESASAKVEIEIARVTSTVSALFSVLESGLTSEEAKLSTILKINEQYGKYLQKLLEEGDSLEHIKEARQLIMSGATSTAGLKASQDAIVDQLTSYDRALDKSLDKLKSTISKHTNIVVSQQFSTEIEELIKDLVDDAKGSKLPKLIVSQSSEAASIWDRYLSEWGIKYAEYEEVIQNIVMQKRAIDLEVRALQEGVDEYQITLSELGELQEEPTKKISDKPAFSAEDFIKELDKIKEEFTKFEALQTDTSRDIFIAESEYVSEGLTSWSDFLKQKYEMTKSANEKLLLEIIASGDEIRLQSAENLTPLQGLGVKSVEGTGVLQNLNDQIQALQKDLLAAVTENEKNQILQQIEGLKEKKANWLTYKDAVEETYSDMFQSIEKLRNKDLKDLIKKIDEQIKKEKAGSETQLLLLKQKQTITDKISANTAKAFGEIPKIFGSVVSAVSSFNSGLGESLATAQNLVGSLSSMGTAITQGGALGITSAGVGLISTIVSSFDSAAKKQQELAMAAARFRQTIELQNSALERQIKLMNEISGIDRIEAESQTLAMIEKQLKVLDKLAAETDIWIYRNSNRGPFQIEDIEHMIDIWTNKLPEFLEKGWTVTNEDQVNKLISSYDELIAKRRELMEEYLGTSTDALSDSIREGLENSLSSVEAFANTLSDALKTAILNAFQLEYILPIAQGMMDALGETLGAAKKSEIQAEYKAAVSKGATDVSFEEYWAAYVESEVSKLKENLKGDVEELGDAYGIINKLLEDLGLSIDETEPSKLEGGISRSITEETGSELLGLWTVTSVDVRDIKNNLSSVRESLDQSVAHLAQIEVNTDDLSEHTTLLREILAELQTEAPSNRGAGI
jgi:TP901 family phage tail tape measure protein